MKVLSVKPKGQRMFKSISHLHNIPKGKVKTKRPFWIEPIRESKYTWFNLSTGQWEEDYNGKGGVTTSYYSMTHDGFNNCYSLKAVLRLIRKWDVEKGTKFRASLPFIGYEFIITK